jgi:hypothetical protein
MCAVHILDQGAPNLMPVLLFLPPSVVRMVEGRLTVWRTMAQGLFNRWARTRIRAR